MLRNPNPCCSKHCARLHAAHTQPRAGEWRTCLTCSKVFFVLPCYLRRPERRNDYCSNTCKTPAVAAAHRGRKRPESTRAKLSAKAKQRTGPAVWNWRGGKYPYYGPDWYEQARNARERDAHTCQDCGHRQLRPRLDVHHLRPRRLFNGDHVAANDLANLITLCRLCHQRREATLAVELRPA